MLTNKYVYELVFDQLNCCYCYTKQRVFEVAFDYVMGPYEQIYARKSNQCLVDKFFNQIYKLKTL